MADEQMGKEPVQPAAPAEEPKVQPATQGDLDREVKRLSMRRTRRSFLVAGVAAAAGYGFYRWIDEIKEIGRQPEPLRKGFEWNHIVSRAVFG